MQNRLVFRLFEKHAGFANKLDEQKDNNKVNNLYFCMQIIIYKNFAHSNYT